MPSASPLPLIDDLIAPEVQEAIRGEIQTIHGGEVFFVCRVDRNLAIEEAEAYAFGNSRTVPALLQYAKPGDVILHNHPSGNLEPSAADIEISSVAGERGIGSYIINNDCTEVRIVVKATRPQALESLDVEALARLLTPGGRLAERLEGFELRIPQVRMLKTVAEAFNDDEILAVEAATGTGKSMAYLVPAIAWSVKNQEKVVISTHTINLQEQLIEKDIPLLKQALGIEFDAVMLKGRGNYLCRRKADYVAKNPDFLLDGEKKEQLEAIQAWIKTTRDGSLTDLAFSPDSDVWETVMSESDNCLRTQCPFYQSCFFYNARRRAARANILIVNHHLLMADLALRAEMENYTQAAVLPPFHRIIIDEAHHLEEVATDYFGARVSRSQMHYTLRRLASARTGEGLFRYLSTKIHDRTYVMPEDAAREWMIKLQLDYMEGHRALLDVIEAACDRTAMALEESVNAKTDQPMDVRQRLTGAFLESPAWKEEIEPHVIAVMKTARTLIGRLHELYTALYQTIEKETPANMTPLLELKSTTSKLERQAGDLARFLSDAEGQCRWIEYRKRARERRAHVAFSSSPLQIAKELRERVLRRYRTIVLTSATLAVEQKFDFFLGQIGADDANQLGLIGGAAMNSPSPPKSGPARSLQTLLLETPFDYDRQVYVGVPIDMPTPKEAGFASSLSDFLIRSLKITRGRAFVLFTSYSTLNDVHARVAPDLERMGYPCLKQGTLARSALTESFRRDIGSVLFATSSFWEGVDVPGEALSCLVLTRLPFVVPSEPIIEARVEALRARGMDPFLNLIVPQAVIRFRQGFGRLIRRKEDRGAVLICDRRVASAGYGQMFLRSLPTQEIHVAPAAKVQDYLLRFFAEEPEEIMPMPSAFRSTSEDE